MPWYAMIGRDGPDGRERRPRCREAHLERLERLSAAGRVRHAGPLLDASGQPRGSLVVFEADHLDAARAIAEADPYVKEGVFEDFDLFETKRVFPRSHGGDD